MPARGGDFRQIWKPPLTSSTPPALFRRALERYYQHYLDFFAVALEQPTSREVAAYVLRGAAELHTRYPDRRGCLGIHGALAGSDDAEPIRRALIDARATGEGQLAG